MSRYVSLFAALAGGLLLLAAPGATLAQRESNPPQPPTGDYIRAQRLGIAHISAVTEDTNPERYAQALNLGAGWNRWPIYWNMVETAPGAWDWTGYDRQVSDDLAYGLQINAILIGRPEFHADHNRISGLYAPIYADGSDLPGPGKMLNPENPWARFVHEAVMRYQPGGILAQSGALPPGAGIRIWEVWNEPDHRPFWRGTPEDYARLLKVAYIVIKQADPQAQVMFGGLLYTGGFNWLAAVLNVYINDPSAESNHWFMDIVAVHSYADPWRSGWLVLVVRETLIAFGLRRPIWLNETGVPVWDDYPGPTWAPNSALRATSDQQARFFIQSASYAWAEGAEMVIFHQLYDDCGDQAAGSDFPPHNGELCRVNSGDESACFGDAHGIYRNQGGSVCFSQHPLPGTPRSVARAFRLVAEVFGRQPFERESQLFFDQRAVIHTFLRPQSGERITVFWNRRLREFTLELPASGDDGQLISLDDSRLIVPDADGLYRIALPPADPDNYDEPPPGASAAIGGPPYILIERIGGQVNAADINLGPPASFVTPSAPVTPLPTARPTVDPALDNRPPQATVLALPQVSEATFTVAWTGQDDSGIDRYLIWVRVDGGEWRPWLETSATSADYTGSPGSMYEFAAWAVDLGGNWSSNTVLEAQAATRVP